MLLSKFIGIAHSQPQHGRQQRCVAATVCAAAAGGHWPQGSGSVPLSASNLTRRIKQSSSTVELLQLHAAYRDSLDSIHYAALFNKLVTAHQSEHGEIGDDAGGLHHEQQQHLPQQRQQLYQQQHSPAAHRQQLLSVLLADLPYIIHSLQPGPLCVVLRALVKLHVQPYPQMLLALLHHAHRVLGFRAFQPRELCTVAHALAELPPLDLPWTGTPPSPPVAAAGSSGPQQRPQQQHLTQQQQQQGQDDAATAEQHPLGVHSSWDPLLLQELFLALGSSLQCCNAQDAAQAVLAAARLRYAPSEAWLQLWLCRATQLLPQFTPQGLANAAYGLVRALQLRGQAGMSSSWDLAAAPPGNPTSSRSAAQLVQQQHQQQQQPQSVLLGAARAWLQSCLQVSVLHASTLKPQELAGQLLWAAGKLSCSPPDPARHHLLASAQAMLPACDARHLCATLYAFALLGHRPDAAAARGFWSCLSWQVSNLGPRDLDEVLWAAGKVGLQPPGHVRDLLQQHALLLLVAVDQVTAAAASGGEGSEGTHPKQQQQQRSRHGPRHVVGVLRGMAALGWQLHEKYLVRFQGVLLELLEECKPQDYANTLWALAIAGSTLEARWLDRVLMSAASRLEQFSAQELSITVWALAKLQHNPPKPWMQHLLLASLQQMDRFIAADYTQTLWALAELQYSPSPLWCASFWSKSGQSLTESNFSAGELHALLLAAAKLETQPPQKWVQAAAGAVERGLAGFSSQQLLEVLLVLQKLSTGSSASAAAVPTAFSVGAISTRGTSAVWSSSIVPFSSKAGLQQPQRLLQPRARVLSSNCSSSGSRKSRMVANTGSSCPGVMRLYRQLLVTKQVVPAGAGLVRPVWPPGNTLLLRSDSSSSSCDGAGISSSSSGMTLQQGQQQGLAGASADEAFGLACLVMLMPDVLRSRVEHFPRLLAAERAQLAAPVR